MTRKQMMEFLSFAYLQDHGYQELTEYQDMLKPQTDEQLAALCEATKYELITRNND